MIIFLLASIMASHPASEDRSLKLCKAALARKAGGEIATIDVSAARRAKRGTIIEGRLTAFEGMGPPAPGSASAHHLIRSDYSFRCAIVRGRVREAALNPPGG